MAVHLCEHDDAPPYCLYGQKICHKYHTKKVSLLNVREGVYQDWPVGKTLKKVTKIFNMKAEILLKYQPLSTKFTTEGALCFFRLVTLNMGLKMSFRFEVFLTHSAFKISLN